MRATPDETLSALVACYAFPPVGGAGVQRVLKLVKYLPEYGVRPSVLTVTNPSVPLYDPSLAGQLPAGLQILRARTLEPGYHAKQLAWELAACQNQRIGARARQAAVDVAKSLMRPDPQVLWLPAAAATLSRRLASERRDDVVFLSAPPFSTFALGAVARLSPGTAVVLDYRDEWTTTRSIYEMTQSPLARFDSVFERMLLHAAHAVTTATEAFRRELLSRFDFLDPARVHTIENGYDTEDLPPERPAPSGDRFRLTYVGTVFRLTSANGLLEALRRLHSREPELARLLEVRFVGRIVETEARAFEASEALGVHRVGYVAHAEALGELLRSHSALCILDDVHGAERVYPAKIFEIMQLHKQCLALCPEGALADLVRRHRLGSVVSPRDPEAIATALADMLRRFAQGSFEASSQPVDIERFERRRQAGEFAKVFRQAVGTARRLRQSSETTQRSRGVTGSFGPSV